MELFVAINQSAFNTFSVKFRRFWCKKSFGEFLNLILNWESFPSVIASSGEYVLICVEQTNRISFFFMLLLQNVALLDRFRPKFAAAFSVPSLFQNSKWIKPRRPHDHNIALLPRRLASGVRLWRFVFINVFCV